MSTHLAGAELAARIRELSQGTSAKMTPGTPSRKSTKVRSGRQGRKQYQARVTIQKVGGFSNDFKAITAPSDAPLCVVVGRDKGMKDGMPFRSPARHFKVAK